MFDLNKYKSKSKIVFYMIMEEKKYIYINNFPTQKQNHASFHRIVFSQAGGKISKINIQTFS
jgi:hypothetical protein